MPTQTINKIKSLLNNSEQLDYNRCEQLTEWLDELEVEIHALKKEEDRLEAIALIEQTRQRLQEQSQSALTDKSASYRDIEDAALRFESSHPRLTYLVQSISQALANLGI